MKKNILITVALVAALTACGDQILTEPQPAPEARATEPAACGVCYPDVRGDRLVERWQSCQGRTVLADDGGSVCLDADQALACGPPVNWRIRPGQMNLPINPPCPCFAGQALVNETVMQFDGCALEDPR